MTDFPAPKIDLERMEYDIGSRVYHVILNDFPLNVCMMCLPTRKGNSRTARTIETLHSSPCQQNSSGHYPPDNAGHCRVTMSKHSVRFNQASGKITVGLHVTKA